MGNISTVGTTLAITGMNMLVLKETTAGTQTRSSRGCLRLAILKRCSSKNRYVSHIERGLTRHKLAHADTALLVSQQQSQMLLLGGIARCSTKAQCKFELAAAAYCLMCCIDHRHLF